MSALELLRESVEVARELLLEQKAHRESSTELLAITRGQLNRMLWAGMAKADPITGAWRQTLQVPFAAIGFADPNGVGLSIDNGQGDGRSQGPGLLTTSPGDSGVVPISGTQLTVTPLAAAQPFFIALFSRPQPFSYSRGGLSAALRQGPLETFPSGSAAVSSGAVLDGGLIRLQPVMAGVVSALPSAGTIQFQGSLDNVNWFTMSTFTPTSAGVFALAPVTPCRFLRGLISTAFTGATIEAKVAFGDPGGQ